MNIDSNREEFIVNALHAIATKKKELENKTQRIYFKREKIVQNQI